VTPIQFSSVLTDIHTFHLISPEEVLGYIRWVPIGYLNLFFIKFDTHSHIDDSKWTIAAIGNKDLNISLS